MKMNRIIALVLTALLLAAVFAGCAKEKTPKTTQAPESNAPGTQATDTQATETQAPDTQAPDTQAPDTQATETQAPENQDFFWFTLNGVEIHLGVPYAELKEKLGDEAKPSETIEACDPNSDWVQIQHYYPGITVSEDKDGNVFGIELSEWAVGPGDATLNGVLKVGVSTREDVVKALGEPEPNEYGIFYDWNDYRLAIYLNEETGILDSAMVMYSGD